MKKKKRKSTRHLRQSRKKGFLGILLFLAVGSIFLATFVIGYNTSNKSKAQESDAPSIKLGTFSPPPSPTLTSPVAVLPTDPDTLEPAPTAPPLPAGTHIKKYCVDDNPGLEIEPCDDASKCDQPHGAGGPNGTCGTVISWEHAVMDAVGQGTGKNSTWDSLTKTVVSSCYTAQATAAYLSTYNVIDVYNLAGFSGTSRSSHTTGAALQSFWQSPAAAAAGYRYSSGTSMLGVGPGYVMFFSSGHVAVVNHVLMDANKNGKMSFLHSGGGFYLGLGIIANGNLVQTSAKEAVSGFGGHNTAQPFSQEGTELCTKGK